MASIVDIGKSTVDEGNIVFVVLDIETAFEGMVLILRDPEREDGCFEMRVFDGVTTGGSGGNE